MVENPTRRVVLNVPGISCAHCKAAIEAAVVPLAGVVRATVDVEQKSVVVEYRDGDVELQAVKDAVRQAGYEVAGEHVFEL